MQGDPPKEKPVSQHHSGGFSDLKESPRASRWRKPGSPLAPTGADPGITSVGL